MIGFGSMGSKGTTRNFQDMVGFLEKVHFDKHFIYIIQNKDPARQNVGFF